MKKSGGLDMILNEHIKSCYKIPSVKDILLKYFNIMLDSGIVPQDWSVGNIIPIYKQKGDPSDPANYRPITLLSCLGKLFTSVLNNRLQHFIEKYNKIKQNQAGFRKGFLTIDHIFSSPEPLVSQGELIGWPLSGVRPSSVVVVHHFQRSSSLKRLGLSKPKFI